MKSSTLIVLLFFSLFSITTFAEPPYATSINISTDIINEDVPTTFVESVYEGMFEVEGANAFVFQATYSDGLSLEFRVSPEFETVEASSTEVSLLAPIAGRLPFSLRKDVTNIRVGTGHGTFTGGGGSIRTYADTTRDFILYGTIEEFLVHEAAHVTFGEKTQDDEMWAQAQIADGEYISDYASTTIHEDIAESALAYVALRYREDYISAVDAEIIANTIPNRIAYFDGLNLNMEPLAEYEFQINAGLNDAWYNPTTSGQGFFITVFPDLGYVSLAWFTYDTELPPEGATANLGDPGHRWITAGGPVSGNQVTMNIEMTSGGIFDTPTEIQRTDPPGSDGTILLTFDGCNSGTVEYDIPSINRQGTVPIQRVAGDNIVLCEVLSAD